MYGEMIWPDFRAGIELLTQDDRAAIADIRAKPGLPHTQRVRRRRELAEEYRRNRAQEFEVACARMRGDYALMSKRYTTRVRSRPDGGQGRTRGR